MTTTERSKLMASIRSKDTKIEKQIRSQLHRRGWRFRKHVTTLPGKPDIVFMTARVVVFLDGDFWHGYRFSKWGAKLQPYWKAKIAYNRARDRRNLRSLRRQGWKVLRIWEHEIKRDPESCIARITEVLRSASNPVENAIYDAAKRRSQSSTTNSTFVVSARSSNCATR